MRHYITLLACLLALTVAQAQDVIIRRNTTTTTTSTTTVTTSPDRSRQHPIARTGTLKITSTPTDAAVKIDGEYMGTTPLTLKNRKPGTYRVTFSAEGYETKTQSVTVTAGKTATASATLKKKQVPQATTTVTSTTSSDGSSKTFTANGVSFKMIRVEGQGTPFYMGETEVTQALWQAVMGSNPSDFKGSNRPVEEVSWDDCKEFISRLNSVTGKNFRLPKESEWEYAAKGGNKSRGYEYSGSNEINDVAWYDKNAYYCGSKSGNSSHPDFGTHSVKTKRPNELGIYDMSGNVWEWCEDLYDPSGSDRVSRGGSWHLNARYCRVTFRYWRTPDTRFNFLGLRLAL